MPRDHQTLARRVGALLTEEGLWRPGIRYGFPCRETGQVRTWYRLPDGMRRPEILGPITVIDLSDEATGGLLFHALGPGWCARRSQVEGAIPAHAWMVWKQGMKKGQESYGPTLGHAAAGAMGKGTEGEG